MGKAEDDKKALSYYFERRHIFQQWRDAMCGDRNNSSTLSPIICVLNEKIKEETEAINKLIQDKRVTAGDLLHLVDYNPYKKGI